MRDRDIGPSRERRARRGQVPHRKTGRPDGHDLGHRTLDPGHEIVDPRRPGPEKRRVVIHTRIIGTDHQALEVVHMRIQTPCPTPADSVAGNGRIERTVAEQAADFVSAHRHLTDERSLVPDDRCRQPERFGEADRGRRHPPGHQRYVDPAADGLPNGRNRSISQGEVIVDEGSVDIERDHPDRQRRRYGARSEGGRRHAQRSIRAVRGSPARSRSTEHDQRPGSAATRRSMPAS